MSTAPLHVLILAGRRGGADPVARSAGVSHKALVPVAGIPMLERVASTLREALPRSPLGIAIEDAGSAELEALVDRLAARGPITTVLPGATPCATVAAALAEPGLAPPLLITTADHPLLTPAMVRHFLGRIPAEADAAVAVASRRTVSAKYSSKRTYWQFRDVAVSGCNLFYLGPRRAAAIVGFWRRLEQDRKRPLAMVRHLGLAPLLLFALRRLTLAGALDGLGRKADALVVAVDMPFPEAAIDVDYPADLALAESILRQGAG